MYITHILAANNGDFGDIWYLAKWGLCARALT